LPFVYFGQGADTAQYPLKSGISPIPDPRTRDQFSFGAGRRICPGMHLTENSLFITLARIL